MKNIFLLIFTFFILNCTPTSSDTSVDNSQQTDVEEITSPSTEQTWATYWPLFQAAVATDDIDEITTLTHLDLNITKDALEESYDEFFSSELKEVIANTKAKDVQFHEDGNEMDVKEQWEVSWEEIFTNEDGEEFGSGKFLYFTRIDGKIGLYAWLAAG